MNAQQEAEMQIKAEKNEKLVKEAKKCLVRIEECYKRIDKELSTVEANRKLLEELNKGVLPSMLEPSPLGPSQDGWYTTQEMHDGRQVTRTQVRSA